MQLTTNYNLKKPEGTDVVNIDNFNDNADTLDGKLKEIETEVAATKKSVSDGKAELAAAITQKKIPTAADATFSQMAGNIRNIISGSGNATAADVLSPKTFTNSSGVQQTGTIASRGAATIVPGKANQTIGAGQYLSGVQTIASLGGNAAASQVLAGTTFSSDSAGRAVAGTMPNQGAVSAAIGINGTYAIPAGYHNGAGTVKQSIATFGGQTVTPNTVTQTVTTAGKYGTGNVTINPIPSNYYNINNNQTVFNNGSYSGGYSAFYFIPASSSNFNPYGRSRGGAVRVTDSSLTMEYHAGEQYSAIVQPIPLQYWNVLRITFTVSRSGTYGRVNIYNSSGSLFSGGTQTLSFFEEWSYNNYYTQDINISGINQVAVLAFRVVQGTETAGNLRIRSIQLLK